MKKEDYRVIHRMCIDCGEEFVISREFQETVDTNGLKLPKRCKKCRCNRNTGAKIAKCTDCGGEFTITDNESKFYAERGLHEPKRCTECREKRKYGQRTAEKDK